MTTEAHFSLDIESLSLRSDCVIPSIALVRFDPRATQVQDATTLRDPKNFQFFRLHMNPQFKVGRVADDATFRWWLRQDTVARGQTFDEDWTADGADKPEHPAVVLRQINNYLATARADNVYLWASPDDFDLAALRNLYDDFEIKYPTGHHNNLDGSTLRWQTGVNHPGIKFHGYKHHAVDDAIHQAREIQWHLLTLSG